MNFSSLIVMTLFLLVLVGSGLYSKKFVTEADDFLLAGRELGMKILVFGVVASGFAGTTLTLAPGLGIRYGFWGTFAFAFFYAIVGIGTYALLMAKSVRRSGAYTLPEWLEMRYSIKVRSMVSILATVALIAITANNILALANVISGYFEWDLRVCIVIGLATVLIFTWCSGMWGISMTDFIQAGLGMIGAPILVLSCVSKFGGIGTTLANWGGGGAQYLTQGIDGTILSTAGITYPSMLTIGLNFSIFLVWGGQHYWIKMASARTEKQAQKAYLLSGVLLFIITMVIGIVGLYAGAYYPEVFTTMGGELTPESAYGFVINKLPSAVGAFLLIFALAASLSSAASCMMGAISVVVKDIYQRFMNREAGSVQLTSVSRIVTVVVTVLAWALAFYPGGTTFLFAFATAWCAPAGILVAFGIYWRRATEKGALAGAICGTFCMTLWAALNLLDIPVFGQPVGNWLHMSIVGIITVTIPFIFVSLCTKPKYYGEADWQRKSVSSETIDLNEKDLKILKYLRDGFVNMSELMDATAWTGEEVNRIVEKLDKNRYLYRDGLSREKFWSFSLSEKGKAALPPLDEQAQVLAKLELTKADIEILEQIQDGKRRLPGQVVREMKVKAEQKRDYAQAIIKLIRKEYIAEYGFLRRGIAITESGKQILQKAQALTFASAQQ